MPHTRDQSNEITDIIQETIYELMYELQWRDIAVDDTSTVDTLCTLLRPLIRLGNFNSTYSYPECTIDEPSTNTRAQSVALRSRIHHSINRVNRIPGSSLDANPLTNTPATASGTSEIPLDYVHLSSGNDNPDHFQSPIHNSTRVALPATPSQPSSFPVRKWGIKFSGEPKGISVHHFIERVEELLKASNVSYDLLFESSVDLFEGKALFWYRSNIDRFRDWNSLKELLIKHYEPVDYKYRLYQDILSRTQDSSEKFIDYLSCMKSMFRRHGSFSESEQLEIISRNLAPFYTMQLPAVTSLVELETERLKLEQRKHRPDNYHPPSRRKSSYVDSDFAYVSSSDNRSSSSLNVVSTPTTLSTETSSTAGMRCFNCDKMGHKFSRCPLPRRRFCYRCSKSGVTVKSCPQCSEIVKGPTYFGANLAVNWFEASEKTSFSLQTLWLTSKPSERCRRL
ncbi:hypothetical protein ILUMI_07353 [Ignelater luminosus]|uniref:CCHC-type domain-containing protein n=1 Tax=Ignelater luminosus TaxID=2038154 RepID=A0A8K0D420_IGNLU|nr:hypothetical protein ILUMI_07353 [Ignelater luminosus]